MTIDVITKNDLQNFKDEIIKEISSLLNGKTNQKEWLKSTDVRKMLNISPGTLQNHRINGTLPYTKMGKTIYYKYSDVVRILAENKSA
jgi:predicted site-specific integrase-resolvase